MSALSKKDLDYIKSVSDSIAPKKEGPAFNSSGDEGLDDLADVQEPEEVALGPVMPRRFNGVEPNDGCDVSDSLLRHDDTALLSERALSYDPVPKDGNGRKRGGRGMRLGSLIARLSGFTGSGNPECLASMDGMMLRVESVGEDEDGNPVIILAER